MATNQNDICNALRNTILGISTVSGVINGKVYADREPQGTSVPYIRFFITDDRGYESASAFGETSSGGSLLTTSIQLDIFTDSSQGSAKIKEIGANILGAIEGTSVNISGAEATICSVQKGILFDDGEYYQFSIDLKLNGQIY